MNNNELTAIIKLLDDPDKTVFKIIENKLMGEGCSVVPKLEQEWMNPERNELFRTRVEDIIHKIQKDDLISNLSNWKDDDNNLLKGAWIVSKYGFPDISFNALSDVFESISYTSYFSLDKNYSPLEQIKILNYLIFNKLKFNPCSNRDFLNPNNSFISHTFEHREGNIVSLAIVYILFANRWNIPIYGINLPKNFIVAYVSQINNKVLFYINPFNRGAILNEKEIDFFLKQQNINSQSQFYNPCSNSITIQRLLYSLKNSYIHNKMANKVEDINSMLKVFKKGLSEKIEWE
ncbi:MAG: transglutaminase-like domain-containing protein [Bacteroidales bacterium]|nr:transglutaminase-like domain-containing protein [Bacteroidales bacterium]